MNGFHTLTHLVSLPKSRSPFDTLRANGILECSTAVFRINIHILAMRLLILIEYKQKSCASCSSYFMPIPYRLSWNQYLVWAHAVLCPHKNCYYLSLSARRAIGDRVFMPVASVKAIEATPCVGGLGYAQRETKYA